MSVASDQGVLIMATGDTIDSIAALNLAVSIRANDPFAKIALVYNEPALKYLENKSTQTNNYTKWFDYLIDFSAALPFSDNPQHLNVWSRLYAYELSPFQRTLYLDNRSLFLEGKRLSALLDKLRGREYATPYSSMILMDNDDDSLLLRPVDLVNHYGHCSDFLFSVIASADYFERSDNNKLYYSLSRKAYIDNPFPVRAETTESILRSSFSIANYQVNRQLDKTPFREIQCGEILEEVGSVIDPAHFAYTFTESDPADAYNYIQLVDNYAKPRALDLETKIFAAQLSSRRQDCIESAGNEIPVYVPPPKEIVSKKKANIPYDVHQIWINLDGSNTLPDRYIPMINSWFTNSIHNHYLHSHNDLIALLSNDYPQFLDFYLNATYITEKSDICRYILMHKYGGVYVDADMVCLKSLASLLSTLTHPICMSLEPPAHRFWNRVLIGSAFIASRPGMDLWIELIEYMQKYYKPNSFPVLTTGPIIVDYFLHSRGYKDQIELIDSQYVFPSDTSGEASNESEATLCRHEWTGLDSWLAQVPLGIRQALYAKEHSCFDALHTYMDEAMGPNSLMEEHAIKSSTDEYIQKLEFALKENEIMARNKESRNQKLDTSLKEAQRFVKQRMEQIEKLEPALQEAQKIVCEQEKHIARLDEGLKEAQGIVQQREAHIHKLDPALKEAQGIVKQKEQLIGALESGLREAQSIVHEHEARLQQLDIGLKEAQAIVKEREKHIQQLDPALREAQEIVKERESKILQLENALTEAQTFVEERNLQIGALDPALSEAQTIVQQQQERIKELEITLSEVKHGETEPSKEK